MKITSSRNCLGRRFSISAFSLQNEGRDRTFTPTIVGVNNLGKAWDEESISNFFNRDAFVWLPWVRCFCCTEALFIRLEYLIPSREFYWESSSCEDVHYFPTRANRLHWHQRRANADSTVVSSRGHSVSQLHTYRYALYQRSR